MSIKGERGFTLVEMLLSSFILALMSTIAVASLLPAVQRYRLTQVTTQVSGAIRDAQFRAIRDGRAWRVLFDPDGQRYFLQSYTATGTAPQDCIMTGWTTKGQGELPYQYKLQLTDLNRSCVSFAATGRSDWQNPHAVVAAITDTPNYGGDLNLARLTDEVWVDPNTLVQRPDPSVLDPRSKDSRTVTWFNKNPKVVIDVGDSRYFTNIWVGLWVDLPTYQYPSWVKVEGTSDVDASVNPPVPPSGASWTTLYNQGGPLNPGGAEPKRNTTWVQVPVNGQYRFFRVTLTRRGSYVIMHEIKMPHDLEFTLVGPKASKTVVVNPVTGRVSTR